MMGKSTNSLSVYDFDDDDISMPNFHVGSSRLPGNSTSASKSSNNMDKAPVTSSQSPLFSMPILSEPVASSASLFGETTTPKKRSSKQRGKKGDSAEKVHLESANKRSSESQGSAGNFNPSSEKSKKGGAKNSKDKSADVSESFDSFGFDHLDTPEPIKTSDSNSGGSTRMSNSSEPLFASSDPKNRKLDKEPEKLNLTEPLFGSFDTNLSRKKPAMENESLNSRGNDLLSNIPTSSVDKGSELLPTSNPLSVDTSELDSAMNNILGLSPRMISPTPSINSKSKQGLKSPQLQTPKSTSPAARISPVPMVTGAVGTSTHQSQILPSSNEQIMSRPSTIASVTMVTSSSNSPYSAESLFSSQSKSLSTLFL